MMRSIRQASAETGIPKDTLRYYDKEGFISPKRHANGYRYYDENDITNLKTVVVMKYAHFSLAEIKAMEALFEREPDIPCSEISKGVLTAKIAELRQTIDNYQKIIGLLEALLPMVDSPDAYQENQARADAFIRQIFEDVKKG